MNSFIEILNQRGGNFLNFAWPMLWQSSLLIAGLFAIDVLFRRKIRASLRYALWLVVLVKLCVPPTLALPTSPAWWLHQTPPPLVAKPVPHYTVTYDNAPLPEIPPSSLPAFIPPKPTLTKAAWLLVASAAVSVALLACLLVRWWQITQLVCRAVPAEEFSELLEEALHRSGAPSPGRTPVRLKLVEGRMSPAVCGLLRPVILLPGSLAEQLSVGQLRAVLLHELIHLRRRDVWVNFLQALLQIIYWWHPLLWVANARIRRVREEAVDDAVMLALRDEADDYAPTLLAVAKLALNRPLVSLGLVGIMESRHALRQRIERLVDFRPPRQAGMTLVSMLGILAFTAIAVPMGEGPAATEQQTNVVVSPPVLTNIPINVRATSLSNPSISMLLSQTNFEQLVQEGKLLYETGKLDEAAEKFVRVLGTDPGNTDAKYYLGLIASQRTEKSVKSSLGRQDIIEKLHSIRLDQIAFATTPLPDVLRYLAEQAKSNDPEKRGVNFLLNLNPGDSAPDVSGQTSRSVAPLITIHPLLTNAPLGDVLDAVVRGASEPIYYSVQDYAIVIWTGKPPEPLEPRAFKVDTNVFPAAVLRQAAQSGFELPDDTVNRVGLAFRHLSAAAGVNWYAPGKRIVYNEKSRSIDVSATAGDLRVLRQLVSALNKNQPGLQSSTNALPASPVSTHAVIEQITNTGAMTVTGILADPNFRVVIKALEQRNGSETLAEPEVVTTSGRGINRITVANISVPASQVTNLYTRTFKVDPNTFSRGLPDQTGLRSSNVSMMAGNFFSKLGVDLTAPGKAIFFNDRLGQLFVRATGQDLDAIENAVEVLNQAPPQIHIKARFLKVPKGTMDGLKNFIAVTNPPAGSNQVARLVGILTDKNFRTVLHNLEANPGAETLAEPECVTTSGRQTQMRATVVFTMITNFVFEQNLTNSWIQPQTGPMERGSILDVAPKVLADGITINLQTKASQTEFWGYAFIPTNAPLHSVTNSAGEQIDLPLIWPAMQISRATADVSLHDGQALLMALNPPEQIRFAEPDAKREAVVAKHIRDGQTKNKGGERETIVFITTTLVDPAGNRIYPER